MDGGGALYFPIRLRCAAVPDLLGSAGLEDALARALGRCFARAPSALPASAAVGGGVVLQPPGLTNGGLTGPDAANLLARVQHSLEADNVGIVTQAQTFTFNATVRAVGASVATLTRLALDGTEFQIVITEQTGTDWSFKQIAFNHCYFTSVSPSNLMLDDAPTANFSGVCLDVEPG